MLTFITARIFLISTFSFLNNLSKLVDTIDLQREQIEHLANYDVLTGLPTSRLALDRIEMAIHHAKRTGVKHALLFLDLDCFKQVNDTYGHDVGDIVLQSVAKRLQGVIREGDTASRIGGDEFIILLVNIDHRGAIEEIC